jgi:hypothetical protein
MAAIPTDDCARLESPASGGQAVDISSTDHTPTSCTRGLYVGEYGDVKVTLLDASVVTFVGVLGGTILPVRATLIWKTGTTATSIVALF